MQTISRTNFTTVKTEGAILPADLLQRIAGGDHLPGLTPGDYHLAPHERLNEAINRAWNRCLGVWQSFDEQRQRLAESDSGITLTRERWLLILFQELGYGRLQYRGSRELKLAKHEEASPAYPISHAWEHVPIHLVSFRQDLDRRDPASKRSPHSLVQEFLNRAEDSLWGFVSNGLRLRVLRDNASLTRAAYVEFDLEAMMAGELYADFTLLWLVCHQSRVEVLPDREGGDGRREEEAVISPISRPAPGNCWLEKWSHSAAERGTRALDALRDGVQEAIAALGRGFLAHPANRALKAALKSGDLSTQDYYRQLLRLVYRLIFLFVAEDRELLLVTQVDEAETTPAEPRSMVAARQRYLDYYSVRRLRDMAERLRGGPHADLYQGLRLVFGLLREGYEPLALPALGSFLFSERATPYLDEADLANRDLLEAIRALAFTIENKVRRPVDYRNLGSEELGSVYESLLELHPQLNVDAATFNLSSAAGSERKTTGSYYTPASLINCLLDSALEPVIQDRLRQAREQRSRGAEESKTSPLPLRPSAPLPVGPSLEEQALLSIKVADPACGSGHFLIAAANRLAQHLARVRTGDEEPGPAARRAALRDVVRHCIYGVDINEMSVELCKVALWLETLDPGKPLNFLDRNIQCGNSLIGATPALLDQGIPDDAFTPIEGDDKAYASEFKKRNKQQRESKQLSLFSYDLQPWNRLGNLAASLMQLEALSDDTLADVRRQQELYEAVVRSTDYQYGQLWADAWCAAFVWQKMKEFPYPITEEVFRRIERNPYDVADWMVEEIARLRQQYGFFHWHLAFPQVFHLPPEGEKAENEQMGWNGGFDVVLGNPPWERIKLQEKEWFAPRRPEIANAPNAAQRRKMIEALIKEDPVVYNAFLDDRRQAEGESHFVRSSGRYPLCGRGDVNTYAVFAELARTIQSDTGRVGIIVPSGIATDDTTKFFFQDLMNTATLVSLYDFENRAKLFPAVDSRMKFCLITLTGLARPAIIGAEFIFFAHNVRDLVDLNRRFTLTAADIALLNPNTHTCPIFRSQRDAELTKIIYQRAPILVHEHRDTNEWGVIYRQGLFHSANDASLFGNNTLKNLMEQGGVLQGNRFDLDGEDYLPLYEAKMMWHFNHRFGTYENVPSNSASTQLPTPKLSDYQNPHFVVLSRYWVVLKEVQQRLRDWEYEWFIGFRDITNSTNERTVIFSILPKAGFIDQFGLVFPGRVSNVRQISGFLANVNSFALDYVARQKVGGTHLKKYLLYQLPIFPPKTYSQLCPWAGIIEDLTHWFFSRILELIYTAWDLQPFAQDCGYDGPPFRWDEERRFLLRCELDAAYFHLYGLSREDTAYVMETFPIVKRKDEAAYGEYRTKRVILEIYDEMQRAMETGQAYQTWLDPLPADPRIAHEMKREV